MKHTSISQYRAADSTVDVSWLRQCNIGKGRTIQPKLDRSDPVKSPPLNWRSSTDLILTVTFHGLSENMRPLANESVKHCINGVVHATPLSLADIGCFWLSVNNVCLQPARFIGHWAIAWSASHRVRDASALLIGAVPGAKQQPAWLKVSTAYRDCLSYYAKEGFTVYPVNQTVE